MPKSASTTLPTRLLTWRWPLCALFVLAGVALQARANDPEPKKLTVIQPNALKAKAEAAGTIIKHEPISKDQLKETIQGAKGKSQSVNLVVNDKGASSHTAPAAAPSIHAPAAPSYTKTTAAPIVRLDDGHPSGRLPNPVDSQTSRQYIRAKAAAMTGHTPATAGAGDHGSGHDIHWAYEGEGGPQAWGKLKPEFETCAVGKRQSPIHIESASTLQGPAEALTLNYWASNGTVVNNGHTIQVDVEGDNSMTVRGTTYKLVQFHFHHPSEERVNYKGFSMVAHLVHKSADGQLAVLAVLIDPGTSNSLMEKVWTYMPLDSGDKVRMPIGLIDINEFLPKDKRYFQFMGSLTTPPCSEGVLWQVFKQPVTASREQIRLFSQLFPNNARPVQPVNGRVVREAQ